MNAYGLFRTSKAAIFFSWYNLENKTLDGDMPFDDDSQNFIKVFNCIYSVASDKEVRKLVRMT